MNRTFVLGLALATIALPAAAATSITVNVAHLNAKATHAKIAAAAQQACRIEYAGASTLEQRESLLTCVDETTAAAEAQLAARRTTLAKL